MQLVMIAVAQWSCIATLSTDSFCEDNTVSNTLVALVGYNTCRVKKLSCTRHKNCWSSTAVLCSVSHFIFPWLKSIKVLKFKVTSLPNVC